MLCRHDGLHWCWNRSRWRLELHWHWRGLQDQLEHVREERQLELEHDFVERLPAPRDRGSHCGSGDRLGCLPELVSVSLNVSSGAIGRGDGASKLNPNELLPI